jgi:protein involved in polysaccharide export with SLBB domain
MSKKFLAYLFDAKPVITVVHSRAGIVPAGRWLMAPVCAGLFVFAAYGQTPSARDSGFASGSLTPPGQSPQTPERLLSANTFEERPFMKGDAVRITVAPDTAHFINGVYHIDDNGRVFLPVVGSIKIDTMSEKELSAFLNAVYLHYLRYPSLQVQPLIRVSLLGGFQKPGLFYVNPSSSLWDVVALAGGPVREDGLKKLQWERGGMLRETALLGPVESGQSLATVGIKSGDQFWITHSPKRTGWEVFVADILPLVSISVSAVSTTASLYFVYQTYKGNR